MDLAIFGATGGTGGVELVRQSLQAGHGVTAIVRDPTRLAVQPHRKLQVVLTIGGVSDGRGVNSWRT